MRKLYKFVAKKDAVEAIVGGSVKFTKIEELNDPSELMPLMNQRAVSESLTAIRRDGYNESQYEWLRCQEATLHLLSPENCDRACPASMAEANQMLKHPIYDDVALMEQKILQTISSIRSRVGILSLSERYDSLPMWAHYGAQAKGYVLCFDGLDRTFIGDDTRSLNVLKPVTYVEDLIGLTFDPSTQDRLFFHKFGDWSYEREWRVVSPLSSCELSKYGDMYLRKIDRKRITEVICGWNVPKKEVQILAEELRGKNPDLTVRVASLSDGRVTLPNFDV